MLGRLSYATKTIIRQSGTSFNNAKPTLLSKGCVSRPFVVSPSVANRSFTTETVIDAATASDALKYSGYSQIDFTIKEDATVYDAVQKFAAFNIGCLVTTDAAGTSLCCWCSAC